MTSLSQPATRPGADANSAYDAYKARKRFGNLDGLRFICIAMVLWHHYPVHGVEVAQIFARGFMGVAFFFVLSGYLITTLLLREREATGRISMRGFYVRRFLRIIPVYFFVVTLVASFHIFVNGRTEYLEYLPYYYLFLSNFLAEHIPMLELTWSLSVEEQYYVIWPLMLLLLPVRWLVPICLVLIAVNVLNAMGAFGFEAIPWGPLLLEPPRSTYAPILMGSVIAVLLHDRRGFALLYALAGWRYASVAGFVFLALFMHFGPPNIIGWPNFVHHLAMTYILASLIMREETPLSPLLRNPVIARVGVVSYGIYLYHLLALDVVGRVAGMVGGLNPWVILLAYSVLAYIIAEVSFRTLEAYFQRFRPKF